MTKAVLRRTCALVALLPLVACKKEPPALETSGPAAAAALARVGPAPENALFLAESGVVTFASTIDMQITGKQVGEVVLKFDHWGRRQAFTGPTPDATRILLWENSQLTTYSSAIHSTVSTVGLALGPFMPEERRTLQQDFAGVKARIIAGTRCLETTINTTMAAVSVTRTSCVGRGIELENHVRSSGGAFAITSDLVATKIDWNVPVPPSAFEIPANVATPRSSVTP
ncbi:MAG: hypothetical protein JWM82_4502 [Myxococcales bacterium]|nr:hypothetical protein [Myxococcales bacterium]